MIGSQTKNHLLANSFGKQCLSRCFILGRALKAEKYVKEKVSSTWHTPSRKVNKETFTKFYLARVACLSLLPTSEVTKGVGGRKELSTARAFKRGVG